MNLKHGHYADGRKSPTYESWAAMTRRCRAAHRAEYKFYGGRGIQVCDRWNSFANFLADMGERPEGMTLDRIDNDGDYCPENCRWATRSEQQQNKRGSVAWNVRGLLFGSAYEAAGVFGVSQSTIHRWCRGHTAAGVYYPPRKDCGVVAK